VAAIGGDLVGVALELFDERKEVIPATAVEAETKNIVLCCILIDKIVSKATN